MATGDEFDQEDIDAAGLGKRRRYVYVAAAIGIGIAGVLTGVLIAGRIGRSGTSEATTAAAGSGPAGAPTPRRAAIPPTPATWYRVTIVGATIAPKKADGHTWDNQPDEPGFDGFASLVGVIAPQAGVVLGALSEMDKASSKGEEDPTAPDPMVSIRLGTGERQIRTPPSRNTTNPVWNYPFLYDDKLDGPLGPWQVTLADSDGDGRLDPIGSSVVDAAGFGSQRIVKLPKIGDASDLNLLITRLEPLDQHQDIEVLANRGDATPTKIAVLAGQPLRIRVGDGTACVAPNACFGPDGDPEKSRGAKRQGFDSFPNGALVAMTLMPPSGVVTSRFLVGREFAGRVPGSGILALAVNDSKVGDNSGDFDITVETGPTLSRILSEAPLRDAYSHAVSEKRWAEALALADKLLADRPDDALLLNDAGFFLFSMGRHPEALVRLERCREVSPNRRVLYKSLGEVYEALGRKQDALSAYRQFILLSTGKSQRGTKPVSDRIRALETQG